MAGEKRQLNLYVPPFAKDAKDGAPKYLRRFNEVQRVRMGHQAITHSNGVYVDGKRGIIGLWHKVAAKHLPLTLMK